MMLIAGCILSVLATIFLIVKETKLKPKGKKKICAWRLGLVAMILMGASAVLLSWPRQSLSREEAKAIAKEAVCELDTLRVLNEIITAQHSEIARQREEIANCYSKYARTTLEKAHVALGQGRYEEARARFIDLLGAQDENTSAAGLYFYIGNCLYGERKFDAALAYYDSSLAIEPSSHRALLNRCNTLGQVGRSDESIDCFQKYLAIHPDDANAWNNMSIAQSQLGQDREALESAIRAAELAPGDNDLRAYKAIALIPFERYDEALAICDSILLFDRQHYEARFGRASALAALGKHSEALNSIDSSLVYYPKDSKFDAVKEAILKYFPRD